ncbi:hypothetical protein SDC9_209760 [bioreactor metagenome]|uniref:Uncharacterized protein n=1 Tax=bioreactor metagenome TaxID=1076179 RepID=A0A645JNX2_9ZZZZ
MGVDRQPAGGPGEHLGDVAELPEAARPQHIVVGGPERREGAERGGQGGRLETPGRGHVGPPAGGSVMAFPL